MNRKELIAQIRAKKSFLCIGLDPDVNKLPEHLPEDVAGMKEFCMEIVKATVEHCVSYKLNAAFFEAFGWEGMKAFEEIVAAIPRTHFIIADAKRGDIGNTSTQYTKAFFEIMNCDALTLSPYMGEDSISPFIERKDKWAIILGLTSNQGAKDFELQKMEDGLLLYEKVLKTCSSWGSAENMMFVVGATQSEHFKKIREITPNHFLLIPGVGAQGGSLEDVCRDLLNDDIGVLVNSSRQIIYASSGEDFADRAREKTISLADEMKVYF